MNRKFFIRYWPVLFLLFTACRQEYLPPAINGTTNFLVVEGVINSGADSTSLKLTRAKNLNDTTIEIPEPNASVTVESKSGVNFPLSHRGNGIYSAPPLPLNINETYRLKIATFAGGLYESDYVPVKQTPAIDSVSWKQDSNVHIFVHTHDGTNKTQFYRWDYTETWEYYAYYQNDLGYDYVTNRVFFRDPLQLLSNCWSTNRSTDILLATSSNLSADVISNLPVTSIERGSDKISVRYSILVKQYALSQEAFSFWQQLKKNSKELGSIFGTQPVEVTGNIRCINNPAEPVIGFVSISSVAQKRIFIANSQVVNWTIPSSYDRLCVTKRISRNVDTISYYLQADTSLAPAYFTDMPVPGLALAKKFCVDCTRRGGVTKKPIFW